MTALSEAAQSTVGQALNCATERLAARVDSPVLEARRLLAHLLGRSEAWILAYPEHPLEIHLVDRLRELLARRIEGCPLAYLTGECEFWSLRLRIDSRALVPRPETELLVETVLDRFDASPRRVLDAGTGSGAIAIALASERPDWQIFAVDKSDGARQLAAENAADHHIDNIEIFSSDWLQSAPDKLDIIVSNPPYVEASCQADPQLTHEPAVALFAGDEGMDEIRTLVQTAPHKLSANGFLIVEHGWKQQPLVVEQFKQAGFTAIATLTDLAGHPRAVSGILTI